MNDEPIVIRIDGYPLAFRIYNNLKVCVVYLCHYNMANEDILGSIVVYWGKHFESFDDIFNWCKQFFDGLQKAKLITRKQERKSK